MAEVYFLGDTHFGHRNILKYRPEFKTIKEHDDFIIDNINKVVTKRDKLILTGDICFNRESLECLRRIRCPALHIVLGNHDDYNLDIRKEVNGVCWVSGDFKYKEFWISHIPIHPENLRGKFNIHAHMHGTKLKDKKYFSTSCEQIGYTPISLQEIRRRMKIKQPKTSDWSGLVDKVKEVVRGKRKTTAIPVVRTNGRKSTKR